MKRKGYSIATDIWAVGVIAFILMFGKHPFDDIDKDEDDLYESIVNVDYK